MLLRLVLVVLVAVPLLVSQERCRDVEIHGHRGAMGVLPEHTLDGFRYAVNHGVDYLELDLQMTRDHELVLHHDPIRDTTLSELRHHKEILTLDEFFSAMRDEPVQFNIEIKTDGLHGDRDEFIRSFLQIVRRYGVLDRTLLQSFDREVLIDARRIEPGLRLSYLIGDRATDILVEARSLRPDVISTRHTLVSRKLVKDLHDEGIAVVPWTVNDRVDFDQLVSYGVNGVITDYPNLFSSHR